MNDGINEQDENFMEKLYFALLQKGLEMGIIISCNLPYNFYSKDFKYNFPKGSLIEKWSKE